jgi:peptidoglycan/xylan/chitin deacetylase (PgdA/CDA1 family)
MYHYVRDLINSAYPEIKGLDVSIFKKQLDFLKKHYSPVHIEDVIEAFSSGVELPANAVLLTFDDGYIDHYNFVFPLLKEYKIQGSFYVPAQAVIESKVLAVNKIHFILAAAKDAKKLVAEIFEQVDALQGEIDVKPKEHYWKELAHPNRFDSADVIFIKRILQLGLPEDVRNRVTNHLFTRYLNTDEASFSRELYVSPGQLIEMREAGMHIGVHGYRHEWQGRLSPSDQITEVDNSLQFLKSVGVDQNALTVCYPYGDYNDTLLATLKARNFKLGMTTEVAVADTALHSSLTLPRLDANDITRMIS